MRRAASLLLWSAVVWAQDPLFWGTLEPGPRAVGFRSSIALDSSRRYDGKARPILLDVWYPAANVEGPGFAYERYLRVPAVPLHPHFRERLEHFSRGVILEDLFHKRKNPLFAQVLAARTTAHEDAPPMAGRFPVVLYHPGAGGTFEENFLLFEYLASRGYVVVSSAFESPIPRNVADNIGGIERSGPDLDFLAEQARQWPFADADKLGAIGHSGGAQILLEWIGSPKCPAKAVVSLDTTLEYPKGYELNTYLRAALRKLTPPSIPVLLYAQARRHPRFAVYDEYLARSAHYEAEAAALEHLDFLTYGFLGRTLLQEMNAVAIRRSYEEVCRTIRVFLDATLKEDAEAARSLPGPAVRYRPKH